MDNGIKNANELEFAIFCIENLAKRFHRRMKLSQVERRTDEYSNTFRLSRRYVQKSLKSRSKENGILKNREIVILDRLFYARGRGDGSII